MAKKGRIVKIDIILTNDYFQMIISYFLVPFQLCSELLK